MHTEEYRETEIKFMVSDLAAMQTRLKSAGAILQQPRTHELNLRFDTPAKKLAASFEVLRLRQDNRVHLTFKGPADLHSEVSIRPEIEFEVSSLSSARRFLEALGYQVFITYEKYRTTYVLDQAEIVLDEMPFGNFIEIESNDPEAIRSMANRLGLKWEHRIKLSYLAIFQLLKEKFQVSAENLLFSEFKDKNYSIQKLFQEGLIG